MNHLLVLFEMIFQARYVVFLKMFKCHFLVIIIQISLLFQGRMIVLGFPRIRVAIFLLMLGSFLGLVHRLFKFYRLFEGRSWIFKFLGLFDKIGRFLAEICGRCLMNVGFFCFFLGNLCLLSFWCLRVLIKPLRQGFYPCRIEIKDGFLFRRAHWHEFDKVMSDQVLKLLF